MMPFAFDLISTFVIGSTLPVATTERTIGPLSTVASFDGSMFVDAPLSVEKPQTPPARTSVATTAIRTRFLDLFIWAPARVAWWRPALLTSAPGEKLPPTYVDSENRDRRSPRADLPYSPRRDQDDRPCHRRRLHCGRRPGFTRPLPADRAAGRSARAPGPREHERNLR